MCGVRVAVYLSIYIIIYRFRCLFGISVTI
jgi:hypothetical protein